MLIMDLLIPLCMVLLGLRFWQGNLPNLYRARRTTLNAPGFQYRRSINVSSGYRTRRSTLSPETWAFAHRFFGRLWFILGLVLLPPSIAAMLLCRAKDVNTVGLYGGLLCGAQAVVLLLPILHTEIALRRHFDNAGRWIG